MALKLLYILIFYSFFSFSQNEGCVFLEGLELPCFGGGVACGSCPDQYTEEERANACIGTLPLDNPDGCAQGVTCGTKCCKTCDQYDPADYYTCQNLPSACDADGNPTSCGQGTKEPTCEDVSDIAANRCGTFSGPCDIECQGELEKITCYSWESEPVPTGTCGCPNVGATPGECNGSERPDVSECLGSPNPCTGGASTCEGQSNRCWQCTWEPGNEGTVTPTCYTGESTCYKNPTPFETCGVPGPLPGMPRRCPYGSTSSPENPPSGGDFCGSGGSGPECTSNSDCSCP